ncbi:hypothetical protein IWX90DRAFT_61922 [Phyllosticta citrichinensis]|uniref:Methyltransferase type 11 domain-containing protein n=1 Tax=Phyllosticta citrichinensis TaxID=1130410 RepID=A0ABR1XH44_9PEZI
MVTAISMFSADLSWTHETAETVGQARERKLRDREKNTSAPSLQIDSSASSWSLPTRKKSVKSVQPRRSPKLSKSSNRLEAGHAKSGYKLSGKTSLAPPGAIPANSSESIPKSCFTTSSVSTVKANGHEPDEESHKDKKVVSKVHVREVQSLSENSYVTRTTTQEISPSLHGRPRVLRPSRIGKPIKSVRVNTSRSTSSISLSASVSSHIYADNEIDSFVDQGAAEKAAPACNWQAPSDWDIASNKSHGSRVSSDATPTFDDMFVCEPDAKTLSDFQRFIRRMEKAGPEIILSHLNRDVAPEDFDHPEREGEIEVERHLWALTALQLQNMENSLVPNQGVGPLMGLPTLFRQPKRALELYSNLAEVYQLSAVYPKSQISFLTTKAPLTSIPLPSNVQPLTVPYAGLLPLPYVAASFNHIRAATLPAHVPSSQMKALLRDLFRILAPGGILELRLVEPTPVNKTLGPLFRDWLEDRLLPGLERGTRCHKPLTVIPEWVADAGFHILEGNEDMVAHKLRLPATAMSQMIEGSWPPSSKLDKVESGSGKSSSGSKSKETSPVSLRHKMRQEDMRGDRPGEASGGGESHSKRFGIIGGGGPKLSDRSPGLEPVVEESPADEEMEDAAARLKGELAALVARGLWKDSWGSFVSEGTWWWDELEIVRECWEFGTEFECGTMFAFKE